MRYVGGTKREAGCVFCSQLTAANDVEALILHRAADAFVIMNLYPYNTGHVMIVPNQHTPSPERATDVSIAAMAQLRRPLLRAMRRALRCHGFNMGANIGAEAGAGIAEHFHEHIVPRWTGDANFMPILARTTVMPELIPVTYAKLRAELTRELTGSTATRCVVRGHDDRVLVDVAGRLPALNKFDADPIWQQAAEFLHDACSVDPILRGWAGPSQAKDGLIGLSFQVNPAASHASEPGAGWHWIERSEARHGPDGDYVANAMVNDLL
ncbi:MAG: HIT domain-containing protein [Chloroflexota bacterium]|nr:HIT domain-containing protein [Chloroflexota bacterium]